MNDALLRNAELTIRMWSGFSKPRCPLSLLSAIVRRLSPWRPILSDNATSAVVPISTAARARSVVRMGVPSAMPRAGQARSPSDSPKDRATSRRAPATSARSASNSRTFKTEA